VVPSNSIAKLERKAQHPLPNRRAREHVVDEMRRTLRHPAASAARAEATAFAGERDQTIGATARTPKPGRPMREHSAANESLKLALHEQRSASLFVMSVELPEESLEVVAHHAVKHAMLGARRTYDRDIASLVAAAWSPRPQDAIKTRAVVSPYFFNVSRTDHCGTEWRTASACWRPPPLARVRPCSP